MLYLGLIVLESSYKLLVNCAKDNKEHSRRGDKGVFQDFGGFPQNHLSVNSISLLFSKVISNLIKG